MEDYKVQFTVNVDVDVTASNPDEAYDIAYKKAMEIVNMYHINASIINGAVFDEAGLRVD